MIALSVLCIIIGALYVLFGFLNSKTYSVLIGCFCLFIWSFILYRELTKSESVESIKKDETYKMVIQNEYYVSKTDTMYVKSDTTYQKL